MDMQTKTIAEIADVFGVSHRSLRFYEERELLHPRRKGTARFYTENDAVRLQLILKGKKLGFTLEEIRRLILSHETRNAVARSADATAHLTKAQITSKLERLEAERRRVGEAIRELEHALGRRQRVVEPTPA